MKILCAWNVRRAVTSGDVDRFVCKSLSKGMHRKGKSFLLGEWLKKITCRIVSWFEMSFGGFCELKISKYFYFRETLSSGNKSGKKVTNRDQIPSNVGKKLQNYKILSLTWLLSPRRWKKLKNWWNFKNVRALYFFLKFVIFKDLKNWGKISNFLNRYFSEIPKFVEKWQNTDSFRNWADYVCVGTN